MMDERDGRAIDVGVSPRRRALRVLVLTPLGRGGKGGIDRMMDYLRDQLRRSQVPGLEVEFLASRGPGSALLAPFYLSVALVRLVFRRITGRLDLVHINLATDGSTYRKIIAAWAARIIRVPYVVHLHSGQYPQFWDKAPEPLAGLIGALYGKSAAIIVLGKIWAAFIRERLPDYGKPVWILPNATPTVTRRSVPPIDDIPRIVYLGWVAPSKGVDVLAEAFEILAGEKIAFRATVAGNGGVDAFRTRMAAAGLADRVEVLDWLAPDDVSELLAQSDVLAIPSFSEGLPLVVIEGFAHGLAVVATPVGAIPELIEHERTGLLVPVGDARSLAQALSRLARDADFRRALGNAAQRRHSESLSMKPYVGHLLRIWCHAAGQARADRDAVR